MPLLTVRRPREWSGLLRGTKVLLDGEQIGALRPGQEVSREVSAGAHVLRAQLDWIRSDELTVTVDDTPVAVELSYPFRAIIRQFTAPRTAITLDVVA